jgi:phosphatidylglycerol lysyltransferase
MVHKNQPDADAARAVRAEPSAGELDALPIPRRWRRLRTIAHIVIPLCVLALVIDELARVDWRKAFAELGLALPVPIACAAAITMACVTSMGLYDVFAYDVGTALDVRKRWRLGAAICAWTNFLAVGPLAGPALRLHFYRRAGLDVGGVLRGLAGVYAGMFSGLVAWIVAMFAPLSGPIGESWVRALFAALAAPIVSVAIGVALGRFRSEYARGDWRAFAYLGWVGAAEWGLVVSVFALVGRAIGIVESFEEMARTFFIGHVVGTVSLLPGGLGSADTVWLKLHVADGRSASTAAAHVLLFRLVYTILPWALSCPLAFKLWRDSARGNPR